MNNPKEAAAVGKIMRARAVNCFSVPHLNELFYKTIKEDVMTGNYDEQKSDMTKWLEKI